LSDLPDLASDVLASWRLEPSRPDWAEGLRDSWTPGEASARAQLKTFLEIGVAGYCGDRDRPDRNGTSKLSPHLRCGEISPRQVWHAARFAAAERPPLAGDIDKLLSELGWREFRRHLLFDVPDLSTRNLQASFDAFPWRHDAKGLRAWQRGRTGYPIVDAGMRELWHTGVMHNRVRMVAASFLVKYLLIDWREGEKWFCDTLVDADAGSSPANWQWVAGSSADAAPYFRVFNPTLQGENFDPDGVRPALGAGACAAAGRPDPSALDGDAARTRRRRGRTRQDLSLPDRRSQDGARTRVGRLRRNPQRVDDIRLTLS
jgi:deoxyribodipyrimidine photo-lyase